MGKWADFLVSGVKYDSNRKITQVIQHKDLDDIIGDGEVIDRATLATNLKSGLSYFTLFNGDSKWRLGDKINFIRVGGEYSIRTDKNKVEFDNLKFLPEIQ